MLGVWVCCGALTGTVASIAVRVTAQVQTSAGAPLPGLTPVEFEEFRLGLDDFMEVETAEEGLGPAFNGTSCAVCHNVPAIGGGGVMLETRVGYRDPDGRFRGLNAEGDTLMHLFSVPTHGCQPMIPDDVTVVARRAPIPLFGAGLVEAIPDETIRALEDPLDRNGDGVTGRAAIIRTSPPANARVGRFGWKAQHATLLTFGADAYRNEMGITNDVFPARVGARHHRGAVPPLRSAARNRRTCASPRTGRRGIDNFESFMKFLAPAGRGRRRRESSVTASGCSSPSAAPRVTRPHSATGPSANPLFNRVTVALFSDLLLHDVGTGDGIAQGAALPEEIRTPALWGLRLRRPLLHDGRAATIEDAVRSHRGEAELALRGFTKLSPDEQARVLSFLRSL